MSLLVKAAAAIVGGALVTVPVITTAATADAAAVPVYKNCDAMHRDYKHGVAKSKAAADYQVRQGYGRPASTKYAQKVYWANHKQRDADSDGTACEA